MKLIKEMVEREKKHVLDILETFRYTFTYLSAKNRDWKYFAERFAYAMKAVDSAKPVVIVVKKEKKEESEQKQGQDKQLIDKVDGRYVYRIEYETEGFIYDKVLGSKKSYMVVLPLKFFVCDGERYVPTLDDVFAPPMFMVALDRVYVYVKKEKRVIRRFWSREGRVKLYLGVYRDLLGKPIKRIPVGELRIKFIGFRPLDHKAMREARKLAREINELRKKLEVASGEEKAKLEAEIARKIEELKMKMARGQPHALARFRVWGKVGEEKVDMVVIGGRYRAYEVKSFSGSWWIVYIDSEKELIRWLEGMVKVRESIARKKYVFHGNHGPLNHELTVLPKPCKRIEVETLGEAHELVWRMHTKTRIFPVRISEYISMDGRRKVWVITPMKKVTRFEITNNDHKQENVYRVLCHVKRGRYVVFVHKL